MLIFSDFHHHALLKSLVLLFEKRLGGEVFRPIGMDWYDKGYWNVYPHIETAKQYLGIDQTYKPVDGTPPLNEITATQLTKLEEYPRIYHCKDIDSEKTNKAITFEGFKDIKFDILIASLPQHIKPFRELISLYQPQAKLLFQIGNAWNIDHHQASLLDGVLASAKIPVIETILGFNGKPLLLVEYHQEFDLDIFHYEAIKPDKKIYSFINCLNVVDIYKKDWELFLELERLMPDWEFKSFGGQCRNGAIHDSQELADKMREATFIYHVKSEGDGYGHVIHNAAAIGRPLITRASDYKNKLAEPLIGITTSIDVGNATPEMIAEEIQRTYESAMLKVHPPLDQMSQSIYNVFKKTINFNKEQKDIETFLNNLQ